MVKEAVIGEKYGKLTVLEKLDDVVDSGGRIRRKYRCACDCGNVTDVDVYHLLNGKIKSCGCLRRGPHISDRHHPYVGTRIYRIWGNMVNRCTNPNNPAYQRYGGRGITVCDEWRDFMTFYKWAIENGYNDTLEIDRIDNDGGYNPENCRWATVIVQGNNKSNNRLFEIGGEIDTLANIARKYSINYKALHNRIRHGWNIERAISQPFRSSNRSNTNAN